MMRNQNSATKDADAVSHMHELPPGPFRSLGRFLDYSEWPARDRFLELDEVLKARRLKSNAELSRAKRTR